MRPHNKKINIFYIFYVRKRLSKKIIVRKSSKVIGGFIEGEKSLFANNFLT